MNTTTGSPIVYSIGHSDHELHSFIDLLRRHGITTLVDVRSQPYSRWVPQFNRETLARAVEEAGLTYVFMGGALGGRPDDPALYEPASSDPSGPQDLVPNYERMAETPSFQQGLQHLLELASSNPTAMMCSEGDHRHCHRDLLITDSLLQHEARVIHIQPDGETVEAKPKPKQLSLF
jgi:uncharacterized protein (DUF488 family)